MSSVVRGEKFAADGNRPLFSMDKIYMYMYSTFKDH
jgi:hypothetical protein